MRARVCALIVCGAAAVAVAQRAPSAQPGPGAPTTPGASSVSTPPTAEAGFHAAEAKLAAGDTAGAIDAFVAVADREPTSIWADDALAEAARGAEQLGELARAAALWRRVAHDYPTSREARRAEARLADLVTMIGMNGEWAEIASRHQLLLRAASGSSAPLGPLWHMEALVRTHAGYPRAAAVRLWIGDTLLRLGDGDDALRWLRDAQAGAQVPLERWRAGKAIADALVSLGELDDAADAYRALRGKAGHLEDAALDDAEAALATARRRRSRERVAAAFLILLVLAGAAVARRDAGSWRAAARAIARPPLEVLYAAPVALLLVLLAWKNDPVIGERVAWIATGGVAVAWISGALLVLARASRGRVGAGRALVHAACGLAAAIAIAYLAIVHGGLLMDMLIETWRNGHDR